MASAAEQLARNLNFSTFAKAKALQQRIWFTLGALLVYRLGTYIPVPGIDPDAYAASFEQAQQGIVGMFDMFAGGAVQRMAIFALNLIPYITASIVVQVISTASPRLEAMSKEGEAGRRKLNQYTRYLAVVFCAIQAYGIAIGLEGSQGVVLNPGWFFRISTVVTLVGGTMFLMWLGEQITSRGVGNGISLIIFAGIVANLPATIVQTLELSRTGALSTAWLFGILIIAIVVIAVIVFFERAQRRLLIQYPKRQVGNKMFQGDTSHLPLKLNTSGVIPVIFASSLLLLPATIASFASQGDAPQWLQRHRCAARPRSAALSGPLRCADHLLCVLLHLDRLQPDRHGRQSEALGRLHSGHPPGRAHRPAHRLRADPHHARRRRLPDGRRAHPRDDPLASSMSASSSAAPRSSSW